MKAKTTVKMHNSNTSKSKTNVSTLERVVMITSGAYFVYKGLSNENKSIGEISAGGAMLLRGISGYCPLYDAVDHLKNNKA